MSPIASPGTSAPPSPPSEPAGVTETRAQVAAPRRARAAARQRGCRLRRAAGRPKPLPRAAWSRRVERQRRAELQLLWRQVDRDGDRDRRHANAIDGVRPALDPLRQLGCRDLVATVEPRRRHRPRRAAQFDDDADGGSARRRVDQGRALACPEGGSGGCRHQPGRRECDQHGRAASHRGDTTSDGDRRRVRTRREALRPHAQQMSADSTAAAHTQTPMIAADAGMPASGAATTSQAPAHAAIAGSASRRSGIRVPPCRRAPRRRRRRYPRRRATARCS